MKRSITLCLSLALVAMSLVPATRTSCQAIPSIQAFWTKFKMAVIKGDKEAVATMSQFPIGMPKAGNKPNSFTVGCKNSAGDEVVIYTFVLTRAGWKFKSLDNLNE